jgi:Ca-activated chloride channel family protein
MRQYLLALFLFAPLVASFAQEPDPPQRTTFSVSVDLVKVPITVFDENGGMVSDLKCADFKLYEDGARQSIRSCGVDLKPVSVVLVIDTSATVEKELKKIKEAAEDFARALSKEDRISVITFADQARLVLDWTEDHKKVRKALRKVEPGLRTALYDAMLMAANDQLKDIEGRKAIILLTDGLNNQSSITFKGAARSIIQSQASLYVVSKTVIVRQAARKQRRVVMLSKIYERMFGEENYIDEFFEKIETNLTELAENTGGRCYFPTDYDQIRGVYAKVADELKSKYFITYISNRSKDRNSFHRISIVYLPSSSKLIYRRGYYFQPEPIRKRWVWEPTPP